MSEGRTWVAYADRSLLRSGDAQLNEPLGNRLQRRREVLVQWVEDTFGRVPDSVRVLPAVGAVMLDEPPPSLWWEDGTLLVGSYETTVRRPFEPVEMFQPEMPPPVKGRVEAPVYTPVVGVMDTGVTMHLEFAKGQLTCQGFDASGRFTDDSLSDSTGHGTFVAGLIAGTQTGVSPGTRLRVARVFDQTPVEYATCVAALDWLVSGDAERVPACDVINISAGTATRDLQLCRPLRELRVEFGVLTVAATGNDGMEGQVDSPADCPFTLGVGSVNDKGEFYAGTDWDPRLLKPDLCALGVGVRSVRKSTGYAFDTGTSYAAAATTGAIARLLSLGHLRPGRPQEWSPVLRRYCVPLPPPVGNWALGRLDVASLP